MRPLIVALALALAVLQFRLWLSDGGIREVWRLEAQVARRTEENRRLAERNAALAAEVRDLKSGLAAAEERARSELGMVLPDESFYQIVPADAVTGGAVDQVAPDDAPVVDPPADPGPPSAPPDEDVDGAAAAVSRVR